MPSPRLKQTSLSDMATVSFAKPSHPSKQPSLFNLFLLIFLSFLFFFPSIVMSQKNTGTYGHYATVLQRLQECTYNSPLGMASGLIQDNQLSSSSNYPFNLDRGCHVAFARLYQPNGLAWCAKYKSSSEWLQVDLGVPAKVTGLLIQGRGDGKEWVRHFTASYSLDAYHWNYVPDQYGNQKKFEGNVNAYHVKHIYLDDAIVARFIKFHTSEWHNHPSMRVEVIGCQVCKNILTLPPNAKVSASSHKNHRDHSCKTDAAFIMSNSAWCAKVDDESQWLQYDLGPPTLITGFITRGKMGPKWRAWVKRYKVSYSNNSAAWHFYSDNGHTVKIFKGNNNANQSSYSYLNRPITSRFVRFHPVTWARKVAMKAAVLGCPYDGICARGFMQVNNHASCIENLAYHKESFVNNRRHTKRHTSSRFTHGQAAKAVDGEINHSCILLDNAFVDKPVWMVDLGRSKVISGIVIVTWNGISRELENTETRQQQQSNNNLIKRYLQNLDRISIFVLRRAVRHSKSLPTNRRVFCAEITKYNHALLKPRLHFQCGRTMRGRYVYVEAQGSDHRRNSMFGAVLCEVMVYE